MWQVHPVVRLSIVHAVTGKFLRKPLADDRVVSFSDGDDNGFSAVGHIMPIVTQPYHVRPRRTTTPVWNEEASAATSYLHTYPPTHLPTAYWCPPTC